MKPIKYSLILISIIFVACNNNSDNQNAYINKLPDSEMVYYIQPNKNEGKIGFINSDGSNNTELMIRYKKGLLFENNLLKYDVVVNSPPFAWNRSLKILGLVKNSSIRLGAGYPLLINNQGQVLECPAKKSPWTTKEFYIKDDYRIIIIDEKDLNNMELVLFNMKTCQREKIIYMASKQEVITGFSVSDENKIAISKGISQNKEVIYRTDLLLEDLHNYHTIMNAIGFQWESKGTRFIYYDVINENTIICEDNEKSCKVGLEGIFASYWTTDGDWLIYEDAGHIKKIRVDDKTMKYIVDGHDPIATR